MMSRKDDTGKLDYTLVTQDMPLAVKAVAEVLQWAITDKKPVPYVRGSWQSVDSLHRRYQAALLRHLFNANASGAPEFARDSETGLLELAHIATNAMMMLEMAQRSNGQ